MWRQSSKTHKKCDLDELVLPIKEPKSEEQLTKQAHVASPLPGSLQKAVTIKDNVCSLSCTTQPTYQASHAHSAVNSKSHKRKANMNISLACSDDKRAFPTDWTVTELKDKLH